MSKSMHFITVAALLALLAACAGNPPQDDSTTDDDGPTVYGQVGFSIDSVTVQ